MGIARLLGLSKDGVDPFMSLDRMGLRIERELSELVWKLPTIGPRVPSFLIGAYHGSGDQERLTQGHLIIQSAMSF